MPYVILQPGTLVEPGDVYEDVMPSDDGDFLFYWRRVASGWIGRPAPSARLVTARPVPPAKPPVNHWADVVSVVHVQSGEIVEARDEICTSGFNGSVWQRIPSRFVGQPCPSWLIVRRLVYSRPPRMNDLPSIPDDLPVIAT